jgi:hypothetical protein
MQISEATKEAIESFKLQLKEILLNNSVCFYDTKQRLLKTIPNLEGSLKRDKKGHLVIELNGFYDFIESNGRARKEKMCITGLFTGNTLWEVLIDSCSERHLFIKQDGNIWKAGFKDNEPGCEKYRQMYTSLLRRGLVEGSIF